MIEFHYIKSDIYPNSSNVGVSKKLESVLDAFYKVARLYSEITSDDIGQLFNCGWFVDNPSDDIIDRLDMMGKAVATCIYSRSNMKTCYVIPGILEKNYYLLPCTAGQDQENQEREIINQLREIAAQAVKDMIEWNALKADRDPDE